jgi:molecular chaperone HscB
MPADFLMRQMEWREAIEEASASGDSAVLDALARELRQEAKSLQGRLAQQLDEQAAYQQASDTVRKLRFLDKVQAEIDQAIETLEN